MVDEVHEAALATAAAHEVLTRSRRPIIGDMVHFVYEHTSGVRTCRAAVVVGLEGSGVELTAFVPHPLYVGVAPYDDHDKPHSTWHWPEL